MDNIRVRFAPSPTGYLHIGGARTALFNYLFAANRKGKFILRIEDTDRSRYNEDALKEIFSSLRWLGMEWDEGPEAGGNFGPYFQSERLGLYKEYIDRLINSGHAYPCFCSAQRLRELREKQEKEKKTQVFGYDGYCRDMPREEAEKRMDDGEPYVVRLKIPRGRQIIFDDMIRGERDGFPTYHFANVVDDHLMEISYVLRGEEWIPSTPRHVLIYEAFGWEPPLFAHLPVILAEGGGKLSKRKGAVSVMEYKENGYLPETLFNFLSLLGWSPGDDREVMGKEEIIKAFSMDRVNPKAAVLDHKKLDWMNGKYVAEKSTDELFEYVFKAWEKKGLVSEEDRQSSVKLKNIIDIMKVRAKKISDIAENTDYFFRDPQEYDPKAAKKRFKGNAPDILKDLAQKMELMESFEKEKIEEVYRAYAEENELSGGKLIHPTRVAVSGTGAGPGLFEMLEIIGKDAVVRRMRKAAAWISEN